MPTLLLTPRDMMPGHPDTPERFLALAVDRAARVGRALVADDRALWAYANGGAWKARCPHCSGCLVLHPDWPLAACLGFGCHHTFTRVVWPAEREAIEEALHRRPQAAQNWGRERAVARDHAVPAQSVSALHADNASHAHEMMRFAGRG